MDLHARRHQPLVSGISVSNCATDPVGAASEHSLEVVGARQRFDDIYAAEFDFAWRSLRRLGVPASLLEDAAQDVFIVVNRRLGEFEGRSTLRTWIFSIAIRVAKEYARRRNRQQCTPFEPESPRDQALPHECLERTEAVILLDHLLATLDEDKRAVFILAELEQMSVPEIAVAVRANANTVYTRLRAARQRFNAALREYRSKEAMQLSGRSKP